MRNRVLLSVIMVLLLGYTALYTFWHAFFGQKNIFIAEELRQSYLKRLNEFKEHKVRNVLLGNKVDCLSANDKDQDLIDQKIKELGFAKQNEVILTEDDFRQ